MTVFTLFDVAIYLLFKVWQKRNNTSIHALENVKVWMIKNAIITKCQNMHRAAVQSFHKTKYNECQDIIVRILEHAIIYCNSPWCHSNNI